MINFYLINLDRSPDRLAWMKQRADQRIQLASNIRTIPTRWDGLRGQEYVNWDMSFVKALEFGRVRAQFNIELYNAFNSVFYNTPNLTPNSPKYALAVRAWQRLPVPVANLVGPWIVRRLP